MRIAVVLAFFISLFQNAYMNTLTGDTEDEIRKCCDDRFKTTVGPSHLKTQSQINCYTKTIEELSSSYADACYNDVMKKTHRDAKEVEKVKGYVTKSCSQLNSYYRDKTILTGKQFGYLIAVGLGDWYKTLYPKFLPVFPPEDFDVMMAHKASYWQTLSDFNIEFLQILPANKDLLLEQSFERYYYDVTDLAFNKNIPKICHIEPVISIYKEYKEAIVAVDNAKWPEIVKKLKVECGKH